MANSSFNVGFLSQGASSSAPTVKKTITQSNTFATGDVLYHTGTAYAKAQANVLSTSAVVGVVESATGSDFVLVAGGEITMSGLTAGSIHYLDASTPGALTVTEPAISVPVLIAVSTTVAWVIIDQPESTGTSYATDSGSANAYAVTLSPAPTAYTTGMKVYMKAANANTTNSTINVNSLGAKNIFYKGSGTLVANVIRASAVYTLIYDGTQFHVVGNEISDGTVTSLTISGGLQAVSASPITVSDTIRAACLVNAQTGTSDTIADDDRGKLITYSNGSAIAVTLPQAGAASSFLAGWFCEVTNLGAGTVTITPTTSTIDGAATVVLLTGQGCKIVSDGTNYATVRGRAGVFEQTDVYLSSNQTTTATSLTNVSGMVFSVLNGEKWTFTMHLALGTNHANGLRFGLTAPSGTLVYSIFGNGSGLGNLNSDAGDASGAESSNMMTYNTSSAIGGFAIITGTFSASADGSIQLQQRNVSTSNNGIVFAGSYIVARRIA